MNKDQDLIFEAYTKSHINENTQEDNESREKNIMRGKEVASTEQEIFYKEYGGDAFEDHYGFRYPKEDENNEDLADDEYDELFGGADVPSCFERLEELMKSKPELQDVLKPILIEFEDAIQKISQVDINTGNFDAGEVFGVLSRLYPV